MKEFEIKVNRINEFLTVRDLKGLILNKQKNFSWLTCGGDDHVVYSAENGVANLIITPSDRILICKNIEKNRLLAEEVGNLDIKVKEVPWHENIEAEIKKITGTEKFGSDSIFQAMSTEYVDADLMHLRLSLVGEEISRARELGKVVAKKFEGACKKIKPNMTEFQIASLICADLIEDGVYPAVLLVAADDRVYNYRHPIPTAKKFQKYAMLVIVGKRRGLHMAMTRFIHAGRIDDTLKRKLEAVAYIDAGFNFNSRIGVTANTVLKKAIEDYKRVGYPEEWSLHHQGGATGYQPREYVAGLESTIQIQENGLMAWNPSITGIKSEDTLLIQNDKNLIITQTDDWPLIEVKYNNISFKRPDILVI